MPFILTLILIVIIGAVVFNSEFFTLLSALVVFFLSISVYVIVACMMFMGRS